MKQDVLQNADQYMKERRRKKWWHKVVISLAAIVVFCTTYALILPAVTMEKQCDIPEHTHTDACFQTEELTCGMEEHIHSEECQST